jgi:hypothetical protein
MDIGTDGRKSPDLGRDRQMHIITIRVTDGIYESITREAARRGVSADEVIDAWLIEGEENCAPAPSPEELEAFYAREDHHVTERRSLREWHESLRPSA